MQHRVSLAAVVCACLQEVLPPPASAGFQVLLAPLRDVDDEGIDSHFTKVRCMA